MSQPLRICIVETSLFPAQGSMSAYADLLARALTAGEGQDEYCCTRINLSAPPGFLAKVPVGLRFRFNQIWLLTVGRWRLRSQQGDIIHLVDGSQAHVLNGLPGSMRCVVTAHDVIPLLQSNGRFPVLSPGRLARWVIQKSLQGLKRADRVVADSQRTKDDLIYEGQLNPARINVVQLALPAGVAARTAEQGGSPWSERRAGKTPYLFHIGHNGFYKNRGGVLRIFCRITQSLGVRLKMAGPAPSDALLKLVQSLGIAARVDFIVNPDDDQVAALYQQACLFLFPSIYEGFGWPPLEAMAFGCPVVCSDAASLPEVVGSAALLCPPEDEAAMADLCIQVLTNEELAEKLVEKGREQSRKFNLKRMGDELMKVYREVLQGGSS